MRYKVTRAKVLLYQFPRMLHSLIEQFARISLCFIPSKLFCKVIVKRHMFTLRNIVEQRTQGECTEHLPSITPLILSVFNRGKLPELVKQLLHSPRLTKHHFRFVVEFRHRQ